MAKVIEIVLLWHNFLPSSARGPTAGCLIGRYERELSLDSDGSYDSYGNAFSHPRFR
jgi:hypothetical protein